MPENFWVSLADRGLTIAFLAGALYFMGRWFVNAQQAKDTLYVQSIAELKQETIALRDRVRTSENKITENEIKLKECEDDRKDLRHRVEQLQARA